MIKLIHYWLWKRNAIKAVLSGQFTNCHYCIDPIVLGDFVGIGLNKSNHEIMVHAGFHFSLSECDAFCETGAIGTAIWDGRQVVGMGESLGAKAIRTGEPQSI